MSDRKANGEKAIAWLEAKWKGERRCPVCASNRWDIGDVLELREFNEGNLVIGGSITPVIPTTCNNCGYTMFFNAIKIGLIKQSVLVEVNKVDASKPEVAE